MCLVFLTKLMVICTTVGVDTAHLDQLIRGRAARLLTALQASNKLLLVLILFWDSRSEGHLLLSRGAEARVLRLAESLFLQWSQVLTQRVLSLLM